MVRVIVGFSVRIYDTETFYILENWKMFMKVYYENHLLMHLTVEVFIRSENVKSDAFRVGLGLVSV